MCAAVRKPRRGNILVNVPNVDTTVDCYRLIQKILEYVLVNKKVLPYPISRLECICGNTLASNDGTSERDRMQEEVHIEKAQSFLSKLNFISKGLQEEFAGDSWKKVRMVAFLLGPTFNCAKEIYIIKIPDTFYDVRTRNEKFDHMRYVVMNDDMLTFTSQHVARTNVHVMVLKPEGEICPWSLPMPIFQIANRSAIALIQLPRNEMKLKVMEAMIRPDCEEVDKLIKDLLKLNISPHDVKTDPLPLHIEGPSPVSVGKLSSQDRDYYDTSIVTSSSSLHDSLDLDVCETNESMNLKKCGISSDFESDDCSVFSSVSFQERTIISTCNRNPPNEQPEQPEKLIWYLYSECLTPYKEPARRNCLRVSEKTKTFD